MDSVIDIWKNNINAIHYIYKAMRSTPVKERFYMSEKTTISFRAPVELEQLLIVRASSLGIDKSEFLRNAITNTTLNYKRNDKDLKTASARLKKIGNNINQIAHVLNIANKNGELGDVEYDKLNDLLLDYWLVMEDILNGLN